MWVRMDGRTCKLNIMPKFKITPDKSGGMPSHGLQHACHFENIGYSEKRHSGVGQQLNREKSGLKTRGVSRLA
ncbi:hypothetical protein ACLB1R_31915 [Escherichia coli]